MRMKTETIKIRLSAEEKAAFEKSAEIAGLSLSSWIRERLRRASIAELEQVKEVPEFLAKPKTRTKNK